MDLHGFLRSRRSVRRFKSGPVESDVLVRILETATHAPSAHNRQPWRFAVLSDPGQKSQLAESMAADFQRDLAADGLDPLEIETRLYRSKSRINQAPLIVVLCLDMSEMDVYPDDLRAQAERTMAVQSVAAAGLQLQLAAHAEGLSSVWTCSPLFAEKTISRALNPPAAWEPQAMFFIGYPLQPAGEKTHKKLEDVVRFL